MISYTIFVFVGTGVLAGLSLSAALFFSLRSRFIDHEDRINALENPPKKPRKPRKQKEEAKP